MSNSIKSFWKIRNVLAVMLLAILLYFLAYPLVTEVLQEDVESYVETVVENRPCEPFLEEECKCSTLTAVPSAA